jgi:hypothetical protein
MFASPTVLKIKQNKLDLIAVKYVHVWAFKFYKIIFIYLCFL